MAVYRWDHADRNFDWEERQPGHRGLLRQTRLLQNEHAMAIWCVTVSGLSPQG